MGLGRSEFLAPWPAAPPGTTKETTASGEMGGQSPELAAAHRGPASAGPSPTAGATEQPLLRVQTVQPLQVLWARP